MFWKKKVQEPPTFKYHSHQWTRELECGCCKVLIPDLTKADGLCLNCGTAYARSWKEKRVCRMQLYGATKTNKFSGYTYILAVDNTDEEAATAMETIAKMQTAESLTFTPKKEEPTE